MVGFLAVAFILVVVASLWLFLPLFKNRSGKAGAPERGQANLQILRNQWEELENDHRTGAIGDAELAEAKAELERRTLEEMAFQKNAAMTATASAKKPAIIWGVAGSLAILCVAGVFYGVVGTPLAFDPSVAVKEVEEKSGHDFTPAQMDEMLSAFAAKMESQPDNIEGWMMLARSYVQTGKYPQAVATYEKIIRRIPDEANVLADYADLIATMQEGRLDGRPMELVKRALKADPTHWKALALAGTYAFDKKDYAQAEAYWVKAKAAKLPDPGIADWLDGGIAEARVLGGAEKTAKKAAK
ncbi:MAG: c-type cytochrome biogenesis protein CcmI [Burkholderiales bacterium]|nr:c-type cytochrome biogenesis protein CcmI [Burkholderiales bacterium]